MKLIVLAAKHFVDVLFYFIRHFYLVIVPQVADNAVYYLFASKLLYLARDKLFLIVVYKYHRVSRNAAVFNYAPFHALRSVVVLRFAVGYHNVYVVFLSYKVVYYAYLKIFHSVRVGAKAVDYGAEPFIDRVLVVFCYLFDYLLVPFVRFIGFKTPAVAYRKRYSVVIFQLERIFVQALRRYGLSRTRLRDLFAKYVIQQTAFANARFAGYQYISFYLVAFHYFLAPFFVSLNISTTAFTILSTIF